MKSTLAAAGFAFLASQPIGANAALNAPERRDLAQTFVAVILNPGRIDLEEIISDANPLQGAAREQLVSCAEQLQSAKRREAQEHRARLEEIGPWARSGVRFHRDRFEQARQATVQAEIYYHATVVAPLLLTDPGSLRGNQHWQALLRQAEMVDEVERAFGASAAKPLLAPMIRQDVEQFIARECGG
jgi:hypothetical protein